MSRAEKDWLCKAVIIALLIAAAVGCRIVDRFSATSTPLGWIRTFIYIGLFCWWGASIRRRVLQSQVRRFLLQIVCLMVFWMVMRSIKFYFAVTPAFRRGLWYSYYIPMLMIPTLSFLIAASLGKPEHYRLPGWSAVVYGITSALMLLVLSNDCHQRVFFFPQGMEGADRNYGYAALYWPVVAWEMGLALAALCVILVKCRIPNSRRIAWLPFIPLTASILYGALYVAQVPLLRIVAGDITIAQCLLFAGILESCIQCGLIRVNQHYEELFNASDVRAFITTQDGRIYLASPHAGTYCAQTLRQARNAAVVMEDGMRLSGKSIRGGYAYWCDDVSQVASLLSELKDLNESLADAGNAMREEYRTEKERIRLAEANRLYNQMQAYTSAQIERLQVLANDLARTDDPQEERRRLQEMLLLGVYVKRRNNLLFMAETHAAMRTQELEYCLKESLGVLEMQAVACGYAVYLDSEMPFHAVLALYDRVEAMLERTFGLLKSLFVSIGMEEERYVMRCSLCTVRAIDAWVIEEMQAEREDEGTWLLTYMLPRGGER